MEMPARGYTRFRKLIYALVLFMILMAAFVVLLSGARGKVTDAQARLLEDALRAAAVNSYATEGAYPATADELARKYGVIVDNDQYRVYYDIFASNIMPVIRVVVRGGAE